ncbi:MAG: sensor histidine kinase [Anaerolineales bacterium]
MTNILQNMHIKISRSLTLHWRLTLWTTGLLLVLGTGLVVLINSMAVTRLPQAFQIYMLEGTAVPEEASLQFTTPGLELTPPHEGLEEVVTVERYQEITLRELRIISLIGVGFFTMIGAVGAYWITRQGLYPVRRLSRLVQQIRAETLDQRISIDGPQDEVKELSDAFDDMLARLERAFESQSRFVGDAAHELRTPLATLRTNLEVIQQDPNATLEDYRQVGIVLERSVAKLERLVEDLLLLTSGDEEMELEPTELGILLAEVVHDYQSFAQSYQVELNLEVENELVLPICTPLFARAVSNLIENGVRYNQPGGSVDITLRFEANSALINVKDTGVGIPEEDLPYIFDRFYRLDRSRSRHKGGAGLGLSITTHIVRLHGGQIEVTSSPGRGSTFSIRLPISEP